MLRRYYGKISKLPINEFFGHDGELVVDDITGKVYVMDGVTLGGTELVGATPRFGTTPPISPTPGTLWYDPNSGRTYIYFQDTWVDAAPNTTYTLPEASDTRLGGVKVDNETIFIDEFGVISAIGDGYLSDRLVNGDKAISLDANGILNFPNNNGQIGQLESPYTGLEFRTGSGADWIGLSYGEINDNNTSYFYFDKDGSDYTTANHLAHLQLKNPAHDGHVEWRFDSLGNLTTPSGMTIGYAGFVGEAYGIQGNVNQAVALASKGDGGTSVLTWAETYDEMGGLISLVNVDNSGVSFYTGNVSVGPPNIFYFDMDGNLLLPPNSTISSQANDLSLYAEGNVNITSKGHKFIFDTDTVGRFIMPPSGVIAGHGTAGNGLNIFVGNTTTEVGKTWNFSTAGNLLLPGEGNITSSSGNITVQSNVFATGFFAKSTTTPTGGPGFLFLDPVSNRYNAGMRHNGPENVVQIVHQGNVGLNIFPNGAARLGNITASTIISGSIDTEFILTNKVLANIGFSGGYRFFDDENPTTTAIIHDNSTNQLQLVHENGKVSIYPNASIQTPGGIILNNNAVTADSGILYVNGAPIVAGGTNTVPSSTPPADPSSGQLWYDTDSGKIYVYITDCWVDAAPTIIPNISSLVNGDFSVTLDVDGNLNLPEGGDILDSNGNSVLGTNNYGNAKVAAYLPTNSIIVGLKANANIQAVAINTLTANALSQDTQIKGLRANITAANAAIITANVGMKSYVDNALINSNSNSAIQSIQINTLTANALSQDTQIKGLRANITAANAAIITANVGMRSYVDSILVPNSASQENKITSLIANSNIQAIAINTLTANALSQDTQIKGLRANITAANAAIVTANVSMRSYVDDTLENVLNGIGAGLYDFYNQTNANLATLSDNANVQAITINTLTANALSQDTQIKGLRANITAANAAIVTANIAMKYYVDTITDILAANSFTQENKLILINANLAEQTTNSASQSTTISNLTANALSQDTQIKGLRANITAANSSITTLKTQVYSDANVFAFLPTYSGTVGGDISIGGNIAVNGSITVGTLLQAPQYTKASNATGTVGQICWDSNYIYICTATNTWKRVVLTGGY